MTPAASSIHIIKRSPMTTPPITKVAESKKRDAMKGAKNVVQ